MSDRLQSNSTEKLVNLYEMTNPLQNPADVEKRKAIMAILEKRNPMMFFEWLSSDHDSPRGYFLHGLSATAILRAAQQSVHPTRGSVAQKGKSKSKGSAKPARG